MLERIMYNRLQKYLKDQNILYDKQFGFRTSHSTEHAIAQLVDQIYEAFEKDEYTLGVLLICLRLEYCWSFNTTKEARVIWYNW